MKVLKVVLGAANISSSIKRFSELLETSLCYVFVEYVRKDMNCNYLSKKLREWFNEYSDYHNEKECTFRFRKKESFNYLKSFPFMIAKLISLIDSSTSQFRLFQIFYQSSMLRKLVSLSVRIDDISIAEVDEMETLGQSLFKCCCLYDTKITPSMWVFCNVASKHARVL